MAVNMLFSLMPHPDFLRIITPILVIVLMIMAIRRPVWGVVSYMILVFCKVSSYYPLFSSIKAELSFALLLLIILAMATENSAYKLSFSYNSYNRYLFYFILCVCFSFLIAWDRQYSWDFAVYHFIKVLILYVLILLSLKTIQDLRIFVFGFIAMFVYLAYEPMYGFVAGTGADVQLYGDVYTSDKGILAGHVAFANNMNQMIPIVYFLMFSFDNKMARALAAFSLVIFVVGVIASASRGGILGLGVVSGCVVYFSKNRKRNAILAAIAFLSLLTFSTTLEHTGSRISLKSAEGRFTGLTHGIGMLTRGNVFGVGPGCYLFARRAYFSYGMESHNIYGQVIGDLGIPGTIAWVFLIRQIFLNLIKAKAKLRKVSMETNFLYKLAIGIQVSLFVRLFISLASHGLYYFYWYVIAALSIAILKLTETMTENRSEFVAVT